MTFFIPTKRFPLRFPLKQCNRIPIFRYLNSHSPQYPTKYLGWNWPRLSSPNRTISTSLHFDDVPDAVGFNTIGNFYGHFPSPINRSKVFSRAHGISTRIFIFPFHFPFPCTPLIGGEAEKNPRKQAGVTSCDNIHGPRKQSQTVGVENEAKTFPGPTMGQR